jgi:hypothetical protein
MTSVGGNLGLVGTDLTGAGAGSIITQTFPGSSYGSIGPYTQGVWLVGQNGKGAIVDHAHLPTGSGWQYYWLGATEQQANDRLPTALNALGISTDQIPTNLWQAFQSGLQNLNFDQLQPFHVGDPSSTSGYAQAVHGAGSAAQQAVTNPLGGLGDIEQFAIRVLEVLVGIAALLLGAQALTGQGSGNPIEATRRVVRKVRR